MKLKERMSLSEGGVMVVEVKDEDVSCYPLGLWMSSLYTILPVLSILLFSQFVYSKLCYLH